MLTHPGFDPVALQIGPLAVRWYGLMYLAGFISAWWLAHRRAPLYRWSEEHISDLIFYGAMGVVLGGRIGYLLFYNFNGWLADPWRLMRIWEGGMSFHGGLLGVLAAFWLLARRTHRPFLAVGDFIAPMVPLGLLFGRIGNFINGELWGRVSDVPWAMVFLTPGAGSLPRHPSQLYEALLEGVLLFVVLWRYSATPRPLGAVSGLFLFGYGLARVVVEGFREPDAHLGFLLGGLTMGQWLSLPMLVLGFWLMWRAQRRTPTEHT